MVAGQLAIAGASSAQQPPPPPPGPPGQPPPQPPPPGPSTPSPADTTGSESSVDLLLSALAGLGALGLVALLLRSQGSTEPAIRYLPVSLMAVPLVGSGRVDGVLVMVRGTSTSFTAHERERLVALAPIAAAAIQSSRQAEEQTLIDGLTGVGNRRRLDRDLPTVVSQATGRPTAVIMVDLDHFESVNDTHRHPAGDALLRAVAGILRETGVRPTPSTATEAKSSASSYPRPTALPPRSSPKGSGPPSTLAVSMSGQPSP